MEKFSDCFDTRESASEIILEALVNSSISTIQHLNLSQNRSWFIDSSTRQDRLGVFEMLSIVIENQKQYLQILNLESNYFSRIGSEILLTSIADCGVLATL